MSFQILYHESVVRDDIPKLTQTVKASVRKAVETKLTQRPEVFGRPLRHSLKNYRKLRVGDYRVLYEVLHGERLIVIHAIGNRRDIYRKR